MRGSTRGEERYGHLRHGSLSHAGIDQELADTTPLMTAIYSELLFDDRSLHPFALAHQRHYDLTLLTGLDLPWVPDGLQRDGAHVREPVDALVRHALREAAVPWHVVYGHGPARRDHALDAIFSVASTDHLALGFQQKSSRHTRWSPLCAHCGDAAAERRLFRGLGPITAPPA